MKSKMRRVVGSFLFRRFVARELAAVRAEAEGLSLLKQEIAGLVAEARLGIERAMEKMEGLQHESAEPSAKATGGPAHGREAGRMAPSCDMAFRTALEISLADLERRVGANDPAVLDALNGVETTLTGSASDLKRLTGTDVPSVLNSLNGMDNNLLLLVGRANEATAADLRRERIDLLHRRAALARGRQNGGRSVSPPTAHALADALQELQRRAPENFATWTRLADAALSRYRLRSAADLAVDWHREAFLFREFLAIHAAGRILDIGVGPLATPAYLRDFPSERLAGLDPLPAFEPHPFAFANTVAEFIPWPDASFETVVAGTSLDHVYLLDVAMDEVARVLTQDGVFIVWTGLFAETAPYDPYSTTITPDDYHLFHLGENWFIDALSKRFRLRERIEVAPNNVFLAFEKPRLRGRRDHPRKSLFQGQQRSEVIPAAKLGDWRRKVEGRAAADVESGCLAEEAANDIGDAADGRRPRGRNVDDAAPSRVKAGDDHGAEVVDVDRRKAYPLAVGRHLHGFSRAHTVDQARDQPRRLPRPVGREDSQDRDREQRRVGPRDHLGGQFGGAQHGGGGKRGVLAEPSVEWVVDRAGRQQAEAGRARTSRVVEESRRTGRVDGEHLCRVARKGTVVARLRGVDDGIDPFGERRGSRLGAEVPADGARPLRGAARDGNRLMSRGGQTAHQRPPHEAGRAGDEDAHRQFAGRVTRTEMPFGFASLNRYSTAPSSSIQPSTSACVCCQAS